MKISENFEKKQIKSFSLNFDKKLIRHIEKLKSPDKRIKKAMIYFAKTGGKRIRPFLLYRMGLYLNIMPKILDDFALSIECVHLHSLIHDDLPSMDNDDYRRGKLTVHKKFDEATAVLAGDMFQVLSVKTLVESKNLSDNQKIKSIQMLSKANGMQGLIAGQSMDIYMKKNSTIKDIEKMHHLKTGALFSLCFNLLLNVKKLNENTFDFVFYVAGVDIHSDDRLGKLKITDNGIDKRDQMVIENFFSRIIFINNYVVLN